MDRYEALLEISKSTAPEDVSAIADIRAEALAILRPDERAVVEALPVLPLPHRDLNAFAALIEGRRIIGYHAAIPFVIYRALKHIYAVVHPDRFHLADAYKRFTNIGDYIVSGGEIAIRREPTLWVPAFLTRLHPNDAGIALEQSSAAAARFIELWILLHEYFHILCGHTDAPAAALQTIEIVAKDGGLVESFPVQIRHEIEADARVFATLLRARREHCRRFLPVYDILLSQMRLAHTMVTERHGPGCITHPSPKERQQLVRETYDTHFGNSAVYDWAKEVSTVYENVEQVFLTQCRGLAHAAEVLDDPRRTPSERAAFYEACGYAFYHAADPAQARDAGVLARTLDPLNPHLAYNLGCVHALLKHREEMLACLGQAFGLPGGERFKEMARSDGDLAAYRKSPALRRLLR